MNDDAPITFPSRLEQFILRRMAEEKYAIEQRTSDSTMDLVDNLVSRGRIAILLEVYERLADRENE